MSNWRSLLLGALVSGVCIWLLLRTVDLAKVGEALGQADARWLGLSLVLIAAAIAVRCYRWQLLFLPANRVGLWSTISATMIGYMLNTVLPGRVGELARAALVSQTNHVSTARTLGTILVEKIIDVLTLLVLLGVLTFFLPLPPEATAAGASAAVLFGALAVVFFALSNFRGPVVAWAARHLDAAPVVGKLKPSTLADMVLGAADGLRRPGLLALHLVLAPLMWTLALLTNFAIIRAFGLDVPWTAAGLVLALTNLGMTVPSAPGYVGVYHTIAVFALSPFGVDSSTALAVAVTMHALAFGSFLAGGAAILMVGLARQDYSMADLWRWRTQPSPLEKAAGTAS
jgi:glycosyltransferase 2 family protein